MDTVTVIQQGDQYALRFIVKDGDAEITDQNCDEMRIKVASILFSGDDIAYSDGYWSCFIDQEATLALDGFIPVQAQWRSTTEDGQTYIKTTEVSTIQVNTSIITGVWSDG